ncbi:MAG: hypothetical protein ABIS14_15210 [Sphingomonas sp.]
MRDRVADAFVVRRALSRNTAIAFAPAGWFERRLFARLRKRGALVEAGPGHFFLDVSTYHANAQALERHALPIAFWGALAVTVVAMVFYRSH